MTHAHEETTNLTDLLQQSASRHRHLCPRQVLGVRIGLLAGKTLGLDVPRLDKRILAIVETDGCFADGVGVAAGCSLGRRTLRHEDMGKVAATFIDVQTGQAIRISPGPEVRELACDLNPEAQSRWHAQLAAYQIISDSQLLVIQNVTLNTSLEAILSQPGCRAACDTCGEEIINQREIQLGEKTLCKTCAGRGYYSL